MKIANILDLGSGCGTFDITVLSARSVLRSVVRSGPNIPDVDQLADSFPDPDEEVLPKEPPDDTGFLAVAKEDVTADLAPSMADGRGFSVSRNSSTPASACSITSTVIAAVSANPPHPVNWQILCDVDVLGAAIAAQECGL